MFQAVGRADGRDAPTRILVEVHTSSPILDKSAEQPFTITLNAKVDHDHPVTIDCFHTLLWPQAHALGYQGFTFRDIETGAYAEREQIDICYDPPARATATSDSAVQLPPRNAAESYTVSHAFRMRAQARAHAQAFAVEMDEADQPADQEHLEWMVRINDQSAELIAGHTYEIGLGTDWIEVDSWWEGNKAEVFLRGSLPRDWRDEALTMEMVNEARFLVVDGSEN